MKVHLASRLVPAILLTGLLSSCQAPYHQKDESYVFVAFNTSLPYWQEAAAGLEDSAKQLGVKAELAGPANFSPNDEVAAFRQAVAQHPSGILVSAANPEVFRDPINSAIQQGIPVISVDADSPESNRILFVGTDNFRAGQESGKRMAELLHGKGNVVVITIPGQFNLDERVRGVEEAFKKYPGIKLTKTIDDKGDSRNAYDAISPLLQGKEKPDGIIGLEASGGEGAADALHRLDLTGKIPIVAFDKDPETLDWIQRGAITATVIQKPYVMSFYGLKFLDDLHHNAVHDYKDWRGAPTSPMPAWVDTGTAIVDKNNLSAFRESLAPHTKPPI
ncbi:MAG TPA: substrate-binding domain-containing protein [Candidatus Acidoferrum sp.]|jgi:ribose transport system substrate-binding protein|nr:substrate-binding domain-containing protein [Candidatus Acidoferrum sp.]